MSGDLFLAGALGGMIGATGWMVGVPLLITCAIAGILGVTVSRVFKNAMRDVRSR